MPETVTTKLTVVEPEQELVRDIKLVKLTNPMWLGQIGPHIDDMVKRLADPSIQYETMFSYFQQSVTNGGKATEFYVAMVDGEPGAFAHWYLRSFPYVAHVYLDYIWNWSKSTEVTEQLVFQAFEFAKANRCAFISSDSFSRSYYRVFNRVLKRMGCSLEEREYTHITARR